MPRVSQRRRDKSQRRAARQRHLRAVPSSPGSGRGTTDVLPPELDGPGSLAEMVREALATGHPLALLTTVSTLMATADPRPAGPLGIPENRVEDLVSAMSAVRVPETTAVLAAIEALTLDARLARRAGGEVAARRGSSPSLPGWVGRLNDVDPVRAAVITDPLGDGEELLLEVRLAGEHAATVLAYIDHNLGTIVKDAFAVPDTTDGVLAHLQRHDETELSVHELSFADAVARLDHAARTGWAMYPPVTTDTWPACLALVDLVTGLASGGTGYADPEPDPDEVARAEAEFRASPEAVGMHPDEDHLVDMVTQFHAQYLSRGLWRASPVTVEMLLEWYPRKVVAPASLSRHLPSLLRRWIRFVHARTGVAPEHTADTLEAVLRWEPDFRQAIGEVPRARPRPAATAEERLAFLAGRAGGHEALMALDAQPLPDEEADLESVPAEVRATARDVLDLVDPVAARLLGTEFRTACRRLLVRAAVEDPSVLQGVAAERLPRTAAALAWAAGQIGQVVGPHATVKVRDLLAEFGLSGTVAQQGKPFLWAIGLRDLSQAYYGGPPDLQISPVREQTVRLRQNVLRDLALGG